MKYKVKGMLFMLIAVLSAILLNSCRDELEVYKIQRIGVFSFSNDKLNTQYAEAVHFYQGKSVLHYYGDGSSELLSRVLLTADGINTAGNSFTVNIELDVVKDGDFIGIYKPQYEKHLGGIHTFNYLEKITDSTYKSYNLDPAAIEYAFMRIERQNMEEKLILGDFFASMQNDQESAEKLIFFEGTFKDIYYGPQ